MLNARDKKRLLESLSQTPDERAALAGLTGRTYSALAKEFETKFGVKVTPRSLRHYVYEFGREDKDWVRQPLTKGRPKKTSVTSSERLVGEVSAYLMQMTGFSESGVYRLLRNATEDQWPPMGKVTFHKLMKEFRLSEPAMAIEASDKPMTHCCLVTGQTALTPPEAADQWLLLWGIEATTSYFNFQLINLLAINDHRSAKLGRPRKAIDGGTAQQDWDGSVLLPAGVFQRFWEDSERRLGVPLSRVVLPEGYPADIALPRTSESGIATPRLGFTAEVQASLPDVATLQAHLETTAMRHYQRSAKPFISQLRRDFREQVESFRERKAQTSWPNHLRETMPDAAALDDFYNSHPAFNTRTIYQKHPLVRLTYKKKPEGSGKAV